MAQDRSSIVSDINSNLPTNGNEQISASDLRGVLVANIVGNFFCLQEDAEVPVYNSLKTYKSGKLVLNQGLFWRAILDVPASTPPPTLPTQSNTYWTVVGAVIPYSFLTDTPDLSLKADLIGGFVPASQLPSYVDDVLNYANLASFPLTGEVGKIYVAEDTNRIYRWTGSSYVDITQIDEATQVSVEDTGTTVSNTYVSPRRWWQAFNKVLITAWTWTQKNIFSVGINVGNNPSPSANGDFWYNSTAGAFQGRQGGVTQTFLTSLNGKLGRTLFVSKDGNDSTAVVGSVNFSYLTIQGAINASTNGDLIVILTGTYTENLNWSARTTISFELHNAIIVGNHTATAITNLRIDMFGVSEFRSNANTEIIYQTNGTIQVNGGLFTNNHTGTGLTLQNISGYINNVKIVNTSTNAGCSIIAGADLELHNCRFRATSTGSCVTLGAGNPMFYNSSFVNSSTGRAINANVSSNSIFNSCYIRSNGGDAIASALSWKITLKNCIVIANGGYAINADSNGGSIVICENCFLYGVNVVYRGLSSPARSSKLTFYRTTFYATTGEVLVNNPTGAGTVCLFRNSDSNKVLTAGQTADANVIYTPDTLHLYLNNYIELPNLTYLN